MFNALIQQNSRVTRVQTDTQMNRHYQNLVSHRFAKFQIDTYIRHSIGKNIWCLLDRY